MRMMLVLTAGALAVVVAQVSLAPANAAAPAGGQAQRAASRAAADHVVLVSIDGFAAFHLEDETLDLPNIRALVAEGARAEHSVTVFPSVTHPAHTTLITGVTPARHGVVENTVRDRRTGRSFHITNIPRRQSIRVETIFDAAKRHGLGTAAFFWPETKDDPAIDDNFTEVFDAAGKADPGAIRGTLLDELRSAGIAIDSYFAFYGDPFRQGAADLVLAEAAAHVFRARRPAVLAIHLLGGDETQHALGLGHDLSRASLTTADRAVGLLLDAVRAAGVAGRTTFIITADHGFATVEQELNVAPLLAGAGREGKVRAHVDGWHLWVERLEGFDTGRDGRTLDALLARLQATAGVARIIRRADLAALGYPDYDANPYVPGHDLVVADIDIHFVNDPTAPSPSRRRKAEPYHGHGYLPEHPSMHVPLVISGAGVAAGTRLGRVRNLDVAPTIAALLGLDLPASEGRALSPEP
jgi:predicted AlkP superfamily pyrophosphatase or phosphodiesterase